MTTTSGGKNARHRSARRHKGVRIAAADGARRAGAANERPEPVAVITGGTAAGNDTEDRIIRFPHLDVAILDGMVYAATNGLLLLGPLSAAAAASKRLPHRDEYPGRCEQLTAGPAADRDTEQTAIAVVTGLSCHRLVVEHTSAPWTPRQIERQVAEFNVLALQAQSPPSDVHSGQAGATVVA